MASTYSALKIELLETGANSGTWGTATNVNLGDAVLGEAITGSATVDFASDADVTITLTDSATTQAARNLRLNITESSSGVGSVRNLILGSGCQIEKFYLINNTGTGAKTVKNTSGTGISVPAGKATLVYNNGTNVVDAASYFTSLTLGSALPVASGGTALTAGTSGGVLAYTASGTLASSGTLAQYGVVIGGGAGAVPTSTAVGTATHVLTSNGSGVAPTFQAPAGAGNLTGAVTSVGLTTSLGSFTSANLLAALTDETGTGVAVFGTNPTLTGVTLAGEAACADNLVTRATLKDYAIEGSAIGSTGATRTFDLAVANFFSATLDQACTFTFSNPPASGDFGCFVLELTNGGAFVITYPASVDFIGGAAPTLTAAGVDQLAFTTRDGGTTYFCFVAGLDIKSP